MKEQSHYWIETNGVSQSVKASQFFKVLDILNENMIEFTIKSEYSFSDDKRTLIDTLIVDESFLLPIICALAKY
jgi:hypothetical protein